MFRFVGTLKRRHTNLVGQYSALWKWAGANGQPFSLLIVLGIKRLEKRLRSQWDNWRHCVQTVHKKKKCNFKEDDLNSYESSKWLLIPWKHSRDFAQPWIVYYYLCVMGVFWKCSPLLRISRHTTQTQTRNLLPCLIKDAKWFHHGLL